jgi:hypothetical protein
MRCELVVNCFDICEPTVTESPQFHAIDCPPFGWMISVVLIKQSRRLVRGGVAHCLACQQ